MLLDVFGLLARAVGSLPMTTVFSFRALGEKSRVDDKGHVTCVANASLVSGRWRTALFRRASSKTITPNGSLYLLTLFAF